MLPGERRCGSQGRLFRGRLVGAVVVGLVCLMAVVGGAGASQVGGARGAGSVAGLRLGGSAALVASREKAGSARLYRLVLAQEARRRWLGSPAAIAQRVASRVAFHDLGVDAAKGLLMRDFGSAVNSAVASPSVSNVTKAPVLRYLSPFKAEVRGPRGVQYVNSTVPLAHSVGGRERPVDLRLTDGAAGFAPVNAAGGLLIAHDLSGGVALGSTGVRVAMEGRNVSGVRMTNSAVFFGGVGEDVDATVTPTARGVELFATLRSRLSPEELRYRLTLPSGAVLRRAGGAVEVLRRGRVLAAIAAPTATDAQGQSVPVTLTVVGDQLVVVIDHRAGGLAYPIMVDPELNEEEGAPGWTSEQGIEEKGVFKVNPKGPFVFHQPGGIEGPKGATFAQYETARWNWQGPPGFQILYVSYLYSDQFLPEEEPTQAPFLARVTSGCGYAEPYPLDGKERFSTSEYNPECPATDKLTVEYYAAEKGLASNQGKLFVYPIWIEEATRSGSEDYGSNNPAERNIPRITCGKPVNCATGNEFYTHNDLTIGGNPGLSLTRTYNAQFAAAQTAPGAFGYGWSTSYGAYLSIEERFCPGKESGIKPNLEKLPEWKCSKYAVIHQENGSTVTFEGGTVWGAVGVGVQATLTESYNETYTYTYTLPGGSILVFNKTGLLTRDTNANGNMFGTPLRLGVN
jgi:hypothetical protein